MLFGSSDFVQIELAQGKIFIKELQIIFHISNVDKSNGNMEKLERQIYSERLKFQQGILCYRCWRWHLKSEISLVIP